MDTFFQKSFRTTSDIRLLLSPEGHSPALTLTRGSLIIGRVQQIAILFAFLALCWIPVDAMFMPTDIWQQLAFCRAITCLLFIALARSCIQTQRIQGVYLRLWLLFAIPMSFILSADYILQSARLDIQSGALVSAYYYAPFVIASGVSFFPLTVIEVALLLGLPMTLAMGMYVIAFPDMLAVNAGFSGIWALLLILCTSALAAISQLGFMLRLFDDTAHDSLTGLFRRSVGAAILDQQFQVALRQKAAFAVLFLDVDNFKKINDQFGHDAGDNVLRGVAERLKKLLRRQDIVIRWGGEEFLIALPNTDVPQARDFIARVAAEGFGTCPDGENITVSIGVAECLEDSVEDWEILATLADKRVYMAKQAGRNCYVLKEIAYPILDKPTASIISLAL